MDKKVTIQDIADALHLSRNTVSKAINNSAGLADSTRELIIRKAVEMGYKQFSYVKDVLDASASAGESYPDRLSVPKEIALFTSSVHKVNGSHFASLMLDKFSQEIQQMGFSLVSYRVLGENIEKMTLPMTFRKENTCAVMCIEIFDRAYSDMICGLGLPTLFIDCPPVIAGKGVDADVLLMDNTSGITGFIADMAAKGVRRFGFIGDHLHCQSFYERYLAFRTGMMNAGLPVNEKDILCMPDSDLEGMANAFESMEDYPEVFICANDFVAIDAMLIFRGMGKNIPEDAAFLGFDDSQESRVFAPPLSTVHIHTQAMAFAAVQMLVSRIGEPKMENRVMHVSSDLICRASTDI